MSDLHAVATGDVIGSSELSMDERRHLPERLRRAYAAAREAAPDALPHDLAILGGDGWQCYVEDPSQALPRVLHFWTHLCADGLRSRFAVAVDTVDFISDGNLNESDGAAFRQSGRALETLDDDHWTVCVLPASASITSSLAADSVFELVDLLLHGWTEAQAQAVAGMLQGVGTERSVTQQAVADAWSPDPITRQSVNRHLQRAKWSRLERTASLFDQLIEVIADDI
ncbi:MAG: hypothetical protein ABEK84_07405 [Salinibacter sp.]